MFDMVMVINGIIIFLIFVQINFLFGVCVVVSIYVFIYGYNEKDGMMDVDIQVFLDNKGCGQGICGFWNDNFYDDFFGVDGKYYLNY